MTGLVVIRDGEVKLRVGKGNIHADGTVWLPTVKGNGPLINSSAAGFDRAVIEPLLRAGKYDQIPTNLYARLGANEGGLVVMYAEEYDRERRAEAKAHLDAHPEIRERQEITALFEHGHHINDEWGDDADTGEGFRLIAEAERRLAAWREKYPEAAREERAENLIAKAEHEESIAKGALTFDADGWLSSKDQQKRYDEHMAKAADLRKQAEEVRQDK